MEASSSKLKTIIMRYILFLLTLSFLFSCETNPERKNTPQGNSDRINSLYSSGDSVNYAGLVSVPSGDKRVLFTVKANGDTAFTIITSVKKTFEFWETNVDTFTAKKAGGVVVNPPPVEPPPTNPGVRNNIIFEALFNGSNPFPTSSLYKQACCSYSATQSKTIVREGDGSFKAEVRGTDPSTSGGWRSEFIPPTNTRLVDGWYGYSMYFQDWKACSSCGEHSTQWHPDNPSGSAVLGLYTEKNTFHVRLNPEGDLTANTVKDGKQIVSNKWYDMVWHIVWSSDKAKGRIELWIDGEKYVDYTGVTLTMTGTPYFKIGIDRWNVTGVNRILYYDAVRVGNEKATYKDVAP